MPLDCGCLGPSAAAKVPVKRYNLLVLAAFPAAAPPPDPAAPLPPAAERAVRRLAEYLERNEHRAPKVSRRLARRLAADLGAGRLGAARVSVAAYAALLRGPAPGRAARLLAPELVERFPPRRHPRLAALTCRGSGGGAPAGAPHLGSVVGRLLRAPERLARLWGLDLLSRFLKAQRSAEHAGALEALVPLVCERAALGAGGAEGGGDEGVAAAALRALLEHLRFCTRVGAPSAHLGAATAAVLAAVEATGALLEDLPAEGDAAALAALEPRDALDFGDDAGGDAGDASERPDAAALRRLQTLGARVRASAPGAAALLVLRELGAATRDSAEGRRLLAAALRFLDAAPRRWAGGAARDAALGALRRAYAAERQEYLLYAALVAHAGAAPGLPPPARRDVLAAALAEARALEPGAAAPALLLALRELPRAAAAAGGAAALDRDAAAAVRELAERTGDRARAAGALAAALARLPEGDGAAEAALRYAAAAAAALPELPTAGAPALSDALLRALLGALVRRGASARASAHTALAAALRAAPGGATLAQARAVLAALWHKSGAADGGAGVPAAARTFEALLVAAPAAPARMEAARFVAALQGRAPNACAEMWAALAVAIPLPALALLHAPAAGADGGGADALGSVARALGLPPAEAARGFEPLPLDEAAPPPLSARQPGGGARAQGLVAAHAAAAEAWAKGAVAVGAAAADADATPSPVAREAPPRALDDVLREVEAALGA
jgi:hypothetical protein